MCKVTVRSKINTLEKQQEWRKRPRKTTEVVRPCEEDERGAHSQKHARFGHTREKKKWEAKPKMERCLLERYDRGGG